ncbi:MAG TPA: hypothetical protein VF003_01245 [Pseudonocardiaceae bacterium]
MALLFKLLRKSLRRRQQPATEEYHDVFLPCAVTTLHIRHYSLHHPQRRPPAGPTPPSHSTPHRAAKQIAMVQAWRRDAVNSDITCESTAAGV